MNEYITPPKPWRAGEPLDHRKLNEPVTAINRMMSVSAPRQIKSTSLAASSAGMSVEWFKIQSISNDYLTCRTWDGTTEGSIDTIVAKPYDLRVTPFDGTTVNGYEYEYSTENERSSTDSEDNSEAQIVTPPYYVGAVICAAELSDTLLSIDTVPVTMMDLNLSARAWAEKYEEPS